MGIETALLLGAGASLVGGAMQANAASGAAETQADAATQAALLAQQAGEQQRQDLQPFAQFGAGFMNPAQQAVNQSQQLFSDPTSIMDNPLLQAIQAQNQTDIMQNAAVRGRLGTGGTQQHLQDSALRTGFDFLNQERAAQLQNVGVLSNLVGMGQSAAAGQGAAGIQTAGMQGNNITDAASATAAGTIGASNAAANTLQNIGNLGMTAALINQPVVGGGI